jgi:hypothetical protein
LPLPKRYYSQNSFKEKAKMSAFGKEAFACVAIWCVANLAQTSVATAADNELSFALDNASQVEARNVSVRAVQYRGSAALEVRRIVPGAAPDIDTFASVPGVDFHNGSIDVEVAGSPLPDAPAGARGFVGVVFRVQVADGTYTCARPTDAPTTRFGAITRRNISLIRVMISTACAGKRRRNTNLMSI